VFLKSAEFLAKDLTVEAAGEKGSRSTLDYGKGTRINYLVIRVPLLQGIQSALVVAVFTT
jgi:hypothetical protein